MERTKKQDTKGALKVIQNNKQVKKTYKVNKSAKQKVNFDTLCDFKLGNTQKKMAENQSVRIAVAGNVDSGKSTLVGVLTKGIVDDGR